jgi:DNA polymerase-3 subunit beta
MDAIVHKKGIQEVKRLFDDPSDVCELAFLEKTSVFKCGSSTMYVKDIDENFPSFEKVIPKKNKIVIEIAKEKLMSSLKRISILSPSKTWGIKVEIRKGQLLITSSNPDLGEGRDEIEIDYDGDNLEIGFNAKYLMDPISVLHGESIILETNDQYAPFIIRSPEDEGSIFIVMPMRM